jgi:hypothetical protein
VLKKAMGGVLFIDRRTTCTAQNERDYGGSRSDPGVMENQRDDIVVIPGRLQEPHGHVLRSNPDARVSPITSIFGLHGRLRRLPS